MISNKKGKESKQMTFSLKNVSINSKMIGFTLIILTLVGLIAGYGLFVINDLTGRIHTIHDKNWPMADDVMEIRMDLDTQVTDLHAYILGETDAKAEFISLGSDIQGLFANITKIAGSNQNLESAKTYYSSFDTLATQSGTGLFDSTDNYFANNDKMSNDYQIFLTLHNFLANLIIETEAQAASETGHDNTTVSDELLTFNSILWQTQDLVPQTFIEANNSKIQILQSQFIDTYQGSANDSIVNELNRIQTYITGGIADNSVGTLAYTYFSNAKLLITTSNSTFKSWSSYGIDTTNGIFATKIKTNNFEVAKEDILSNADQIFGSLTAQLDLLEQSATNKMNSIDASSDASIIAMASLSIVLAVITLTLGMLFARSISKPIKNVADISKILAQGDLSQTVKEENRKDEIGVLYNSFAEMSSFLRKMIENITQLSRSLATSAEEMASSSEEVNASSEEISSISQQMSKGAQDQSNQISDSLKYSNSLQELFETKIGDINSAAGLIESISSQVNMLALNASIEAARAGEYGRGFAVVADNIRRLADESKNSVNTVQTTIQSLRDSLSQSINNITTSIERVASVAEETASGAEESSAATEEQAATMQELSASAQELTQVALSLEKVVNSFKI